MRAWQKTPARPDRAAISVIRRVTALWA